MDTKILPTKSLLYSILMVLLSSSLVSSFSQSAVLESQDITLAIVNVSGLVPFTGLASNFKDDIPIPQLGKFASLTGILIRSKSPLSESVDNGTGTDDHKLYTDDACHPIKLDWIPRDKWILLVQYGHCSDETKYKHISRTNSTGVLMYDNVPGHRLVKFDPPGMWISNVHFPMMKLYKIQTSVLIFFLKNLLSFAAGLWP